MAAQDDLIIELPKELVEKSSGFGLDIGGSAVKFAYRHKDDWEEYLKQKEQVGRVKVRMRIYPMDRLEEALHFLKENCHITRDGTQPPLVYTTGGGSYHHANVVNKILDVKSEILWEVDFINDGILHLTKFLSREKFEYLPSDEEKTDLLKIMTNMQHLLSTFCIPGLTKQRLASVENLDLTSAMKFDASGEIPFATAIQDMYPCLIFYSHSASTYGLMKTADDYGVMSPANSGGRAFLGLGALLLGSKKTYDELIDIAENGDNFNVDQTFKSIAAEDGGQHNFYAYLMENSAADGQTLYAFGQAAIKSPETFKKEDIIRTLLGMIIREQIGGMFPQIFANRTRHVIVVGSFTRRHLVRQLMLREFARQKVAYAATNNGKGFDAQIHFPKTAPYLGCIGAFMKSKEPCLSSKTNYRGHQGDITVL